MKLLDSGNVSMTGDDLDALRRKGYTVNLHAPTYANNITVQMANGETIGFHCWLDNLEFYIGDEMVPIVSQDHLDQCFAMMDAILAFHKLSK